VVVTEDGDEYVRRIMIEENPTAETLEFSGWNHRDSDADVIVIHVALEENDPLLKWNILKIKAQGENVLYRVDKVRVSFDKRHFMTLVAFPWSYPEEHTIDQRTVDVVTNERDDDGKQIIEGQVIVQNNFGNTGRVLPTADYDKYNRQGD